MNTLIISGNIVRDSEMNYLSNNNNNVVLKFTIANNYTYKKKGEYKKETLFLDAELYGKIEFIQSMKEKLKKGRLVLLQGRLKSNTWTNKNGENRNKISLVCFNVEVFNNPSKSNETKKSFEDNEKKEEKNKKEESSLKKEEAKVEVNDDEIPF